MSYEKTAMLHPAEIKPPKKKMFSLKEVIDILRKKVNKGCRSKSEPEKKSKAQSEGLNSKLQNQK